jgi:hypothetical protein
MEPKPNLIDHEVRIREIERLLKHYDEKYKDNEAKLSGQYTWIISTVVTSVSALLLHLIKLI